MSRRRFLTGLLIAFALFVAAVLQHTGRAPVATGAAEAQSTPKTGLLSVWNDRLAVDGFRSAALSNDGSYFVVVAGRKSVITVHRQDGKPVWKRSAPGCNTAVVSSDGQSVLAFAALDPTRPGVTLLQGSKGQAVTSFKLDGAIWDAQTSSDSRLAAIVTGNHSLYLFNLKAKPVVGTRWPIEGAGNSVAISPDSRYIAAGTWDESGVTCYDLKGNVVWSYQAEDDQHRAVLNRLFEAQIAQERPVVLGVSYANARHTDATVYLWSIRGRGHPLWRHELGADTSDPKARITPDGNYVVVTFVQDVVHGDRSLQERRLLILDRTGNKVDEMGGPLLPPNLVTVSHDGGSVIISDGQNALYTVSPEGHISPGKILPALIYRTIASQDGRLVLVYTSDGKLDMLKLA